LVINFYHIETILAVDVVVVVGQLITLDGGDTVRQELVVLCLLSSTSQVCEKLGVLLDDTDGVDAGVGADDEDSIGKD